MTTTVQVSRTQRSVRVAALLAAAVVLASGGTARTAEPAEAGAAGRIADLAWMAGAWAGEEGKGQMEEYWTAPKGGAMLGVHRDVVDGKMVSFEFLRIEERSGSLVYLSMPQGRPVTPFPLAKLEGKRIVFENPSHDFPQRILYRLEADGSLAARIEGTSAKGEKAAEWRWRPASLK